MSITGNNDALYFDIWRKKNFRDLIMAYVKVAEQYLTKQEMRENFGAFLDRYLSDGKGTYDGSSRKWQSAYTLGIELGIFYQENAHSGYDISPLARAVLNSQITLEEYLLIYILNLNQLINNRIAHPLKEVLIVLNINDGQITKETLKTILNFRLSSKTQKNQNQLVNILLHRLVEAEILQKIGQNYSLDKYSFEELMENLNEYSGTIDGFERMGQTGYIDMISRPNNALVPHYSIS